MVTTSSGDNGDGPIVTSVKPASGTAGKTAGMIITGEDFTQGSSVALISDSESISASRQSMINPKKIFVILKIPGSAVSGSYDVVVTDTMGWSGTLPAGFTIVGIPATQK